LPGQQPGRVPPLHCVGAPLLPGLSGTGNIITSKSGNLVRVAGAGGVRRLTAFPVGVKQLRVIAPKDPEARIRIEAADEI
jgi:hypothetical protein